MQNYIKYILKVLIYIERHIEKELTIEELSKIACYSPFHFHRIFRIIVGETVHKYIKRLRIEKAAGQLRHTDSAITNIALQANFETPSAFTKAFKQCLGSSPRKYRSLYKEASKLTKKIREIPMIHPDKIEKIANIPLLFIRRPGNYVTSSESAWNALLEFVKINHLDTSKLRYFSIAHDDPHITDEEKLRFDACILDRQEIQGASDIGRQVLKEGKYAIFTHNGPHHTLEETFNKIFLKWVPNSKERLDENRPLFSEHLHLEHVNKDESKLVTKIYIPVT